MDTHIHTSIYLSMDLYIYIYIYTSTEKMLRLCSQQTRQLTPRRGTVAHLGNQECCVHIRTGNLSTYSHRTRRFELTPTVDSGTSMPLGLELARSIYPSIDLYIHLYIHIVTGLVSQHSRNGHAD